MKFAASVLVTLNDAELEPRQGRACLFDGDHETGSRRTGADDDCRVSLWSQCRGGAPGSELTLSNNVEQPVMGAEGWLLSHPA